MLKIQKVAGQWTGPVLEHHHYITITIIANNIEGIQTFQSNPETG